MKFLLFKFLILKMDTHFWKGGSTFLKRIYIREQKHSVLTGCTCRQHVTDFKLTEPNM